MGRCQNNSGKIKTQRRKESYMGMGKEMKQEGSCQGMV